MRKDRLYEENLLVGGVAGGEDLSKNERQTLRREASELKQRMEQARQQEIKE
ncbi:hypothetical protein [Brevibacillus massiliensis]|uniref:hypothetical protein n=1 Tax=Brevibacillus massiliensis TaxID=1118054 RepID=UPI0002FD317E|nr:hypothetical protein [Brevibacillus massiliensis]